MKGNSKSGRALWALRRMKLGLPAVFLCCVLFFLAGFFGSMIPPADLTGGMPHRMRLNEVEEPGMAHGESGEDRVSALPFQVLSWNPRAVYFPNFANKKQCETIVRVAKGKLKPSTLALRKGETSESTKGIRTSSGTFLSASEDPSGVMDIIEQKIARATMIPKEHGENHVQYHKLHVMGYLLGEGNFWIFIILDKRNGWNGLNIYKYLVGGLKSVFFGQCTENQLSLGQISFSPFFVFDAPCIYYLFCLSLNSLSNFSAYPIFFVGDVTMMQAFNILRYEIGQRYASHYDAFNPAEYGPQKSQRVASFLLYLTDVVEGGETMFPYENGLNMNSGYDYEECIGLKVKPRQGDGLLFYSVFINGTIDPKSLHGSCPVIKGEKWVATKWLRDQVLD